MRNKWVTVVIKLEQWPDHLKRFAARQHCVYSDCDLMHKMDKNPANNGIKSIIHRSTANYKMS